MLSIDFNIAYRQAESMAQCADEMLHQRKILDGIIAEIRSFWCGWAANTYVKKLETFGSRLQENAIQCREDAATFRARIDALKEAEEKACTLLEKKGN